MISLTNKRVLLGVTGSIAAYKSADLARRLKERGADVRVVMTTGATQFITPLTMQAVSGHPVHQHLLDTQSEAAMGHIDLARWADAVLVAPASANFLSRLAEGRSDDLLSAVCLATSAPVSVAPAMNRQMWAHPQTQSNVARVMANGIQVWGPAEGEQACGETGSGRMLEPLELVTLISQLFKPGTLAGLNVMVTAGPTWEALDPVRGITNHSSGRMGYAVAEAAVEAGASVTLISGPTHLDPPDRARLVNVISALDMYQSVMNDIADMDIFISVAAVADYRPAETKDQKIKKSTETMTLELVRNPDILAAVAALNPRPFTVGFAAETHDLQLYAEQKRLQKNVDIVAANPVCEAGIGFHAEDNRLVVFGHDGKTEFPKQTKSQLARGLINLIAKGYHAQSTSKDPRQTSRR